MRMQLTRVDLAKIVDPPVNLTMPARERWRVVALYESDDGAAFSGAKTFDVYSDAVRAMGEDTPQSIDVQLAP